jgi:hypothetical protein
MSESKKEFLQFLTQATAVPSALAKTTRLDVLLTFKKKSILTKFALYQFLGAFFTLSFCPQFGVGLVEGHGITHYFRMIGDWACAVFCGSLFLSAGMLLAYVGMKGEELWWVWRHYKMRLIFSPALLWSILMLANVSFESPKETASYHLSWFAAAILAQAFWFITRSLYVRKQLS